MIRSTLPLIAFTLSLAMSSADAQMGKPNTGLPTTKLKIGDTTIVAEVAATNEQRSTGLMYRFSLPPDGGMLFVFDAPRPLSFWMRNTYVALSIAFIDAHGTILNIADMAPRDERSTWSTGAALYALEMRKGWFAQNGIVAGARVEGLPGKAAE